MTNRRFALILAALLLVILPLTFAASVQVGNRLFDHRVAPTRIEEDDPNWDCHTMGNLRCGPGAAEATAAQLKAGPNFLCLAEENLDMPEGFEVICYPNGN